MNKYRLFPGFVEPPAFDKLSALDEPTHKGRPIHVWLEQLFDARELNRAHAERELREMGADALPAILTYLSHALWFHSTRSLEIAETSFKILGTVARSAIPNLLEIMGRVNDTHFFGSFAVQLMLTRTARESIGLLAEYLPNPNPNIRRAVLEVLRMYSLESPPPPGFESVVPAIQRWGGENFLRPFITAENWLRMLAAKAALEATGAHPLPPDAPEVTERP